MVGIELDSGSMLVRYVKTGFETGGVAHVLCVFKLARIILLRI